MDKRNKKKKTRKVKLLKKQFWRKEEVVEVGRARGERRKGSKDRKKLERK